MSFAQLDAPKYVPYLDLSGGLNTKKDAHALDRNQLAISSNTWLGTGNAISKRPGSVPYAGGATGAGVTVGLARTRYGGQTCVIAQSTTGALSYARPTDATWTSFGTSTAGAFPIRAAEMYDPDGTSATTTFIVNGVDAPRTWTGPGGTYGTVLTTGLHCPYNHTNSAPITPKYVATAGFYLAYAGEPTEPTGVYISNPFHPQNFNISATTDTTVLANPYIPYLVGFNDGIAGGDITGIEQYPDGTSTGGFVIYKQAAIYRMNQVGFFGEMYWGATLVSGSVGCVADRSIASFDTFRCFLGIDGVYQEDGATVRRISDNVPTLFDSTLTGYPASITARSTAIGVRHGQRYILFYDDGNGTPVPAGYCTAGAVFDFAKLDVDGLPAVSLISGMTPSGAVPMRGAQDDGNFVWCDATKDSTARFGVGFADLGKPITVQFAGKADFMTEVFGPEAPICEKNVTFAHLLLSVVSVAPGETLTFMSLCTVDVATSLATGVTFLTAPANAAVYGTYAPAAVYGGGAIYVGSQVARFTTVKFEPPISAQGHVVQFGITETSTLPWTVLGYVLYVSCHKVDQ